jgi:hypothetical protein
MIRHLFRSHAKRGSILLLFEVLSWHGFRIELDDRGKWVALKLGARLWVFAQTSVDVSAAER